MLEEDLSPRAGEALLRLAANPDLPLSAVADEDWPALTQRAAEARLTPLLHRAVTSSAAPVRMPDATHRALSADRQWYRFNALRQQAALGRVAARLDGLGCRYIVLKGAALAPHCYPDPGLRPMRDLDLLIAPGMAATVQQALLDDGAYTVHPDLRGTRRTSPDHLAPLQDRTHGVTIELHHRIGSWGGAGAVEAALWQDCAPIPIAGAPVCVSPPEATLLHLVAGAVMKDRLAMAALVLADLHFAARGPLDWDRVIHLAGVANVRQALALLAAVAIRYDAEWVPPALAADASEAEAHVAPATAALLQPAATVHAAKILLRAERERAAGPLGALGLAISPDPVQLARHAGTDPDSPWRWAGYPRWLLDRAIAYRRAKREARRSESEAVRAMRTWLGGNGQR